MYALYVDRCGDRAPKFEELYGGYPVSTDDLRNEEAIVRSMFIDRGSSVWQHLVVPLLQPIRASDFDPEMPEYHDLAFTQYLGAKALYQYRIALEPEFEEFVRIFDQVDATIEKERLWRWARSASTDH